MNPTSIHEDTGLIPGLVQGVKELVLLWLWCSVAAAASIRPLAWEPPFATKETKKTKGKKKKKRTKILGKFPRVQLIKYNQFSRKIK